MPSLFEKYRPRDWGEIVGQDAAVASLASLRQRSGGFGGRAFWLAGPSGSGKSTIARLIAAETADKLCIEEGDAGSITLSDVEDWTRRSANRPLFGRGWAWIINEAHGLRKDVIRSLLVALEELTPFAVVCFTTTNEGQQSLFDSKEDASPLCSRCFTPPMVTKQRELAPAFAARAREIALAENLDGQPFGAYVDLAMREKCNLRSMLQRIEAGTMIA